jgi:hypothetical protein
MASRAANTNRPAQSDMKKILAAEGKVEKRRVDCLAAEQPALSGSCWRFSGRGKG